MRTYPDMFTLARYGESAAPWPTWGLAERSLCRAQPGAPHGQRGCYREHLARVLVRQRPAWAGRLRSHAYPR